MIFWGLAGTSTVRPTMSVMVWVAAAEALADDAAAEELSDDVAAELDAEPELEAPLDAEPDDEHPTSAKTPMASKAAIMTSIILTWFFTGAPFAYHSIA